MNLEAGFRDADLLTILFPNADGKMIPRESDRFMEVAFTKDLWLSTHFYRGLVFDFARMIGKVNFSLLRNVRIKGILKDRYWFGHGCIANRLSIHLPRALPLLTHLFNVARPNLRKLVICMEEHPISYSHVG
jgi:hypothetical protein